ncbi:MAG: helix-turn-helix domain-containing protein [Anaerolineaceae bacterium]|nr:helix-turn-helix domain-containing protein [Anaerolineaceae bacterium]
MTMKKADLILHPVRFRILQVLINTEMTTYEISENLLSVPTSSIYRHLRILLDAGLVEVAQSHLVKGIEEKVYRLAERPRVRGEDMAGYSGEEHKRLFGAYISTLLSGFSEYVDSSQKLDLEHDRVGYTDMAFYATMEEFEMLAVNISEILDPLRESKPGTDKQRQLFSIITFPLKRKEKLNG